MVAVRTPDWQPAVRDPRPGRNADPFRAYEDTFPDSCRSGDAPMSAAEPVNGPDHPVEFPGTVLPFPPSRPRRHPRSERTTVPPQQTRSGDLTPHERIAAKLEGAFKRHQRTLTDDGTALDFRITLTEMRTLLKGALETGILNEEQHQSLDSMVEGMLAAAELLAGGE